MKLKKVCVTIPEERVSELMRLAAIWREEHRQVQSPNSGIGSYTPGGDAKAISRIAKEKFGGFREMFVFHDWPERGSEMMRKVQYRVAETYGTIANFEKEWAEK